MRRRESRAAPEQRATPARLSITSRPGGCGCRDRSLVMTPSPSIRGMTAQRGRPFPGPDLGFAASVRGFLHFLHTTAVNKVAGLSEEPARRTPLPTSPAVSPLGLVQHLTAVYRQHL